MKKKYLNRIIFDETALFFVSQKGVFLSLYMCKIKKYKNKVLQKKIQVKYDHFWTFFLSYRYIIII